MEQNATLTSLLYIVLNTAVLLLLRLQFDSVTKLVTLDEVESLIKLGTRFTLVVVILIYKTF